MCAVPANASLSREDHPGPLERFRRLGADGSRAIDRPAAENATTIPQAGEILLYPGGVSEVEILIPYGPTYFASVAGPLAGNHFLTVVEGREHPPELGRLVQWEGARDIVFAPA